MRGASVTTDEADLSPLTPHPTELACFIAELERRGFSHDEHATWRGPRPEVLNGIADADHMTIIIRDGWPYRPPLTRVPGIDSWHADRDNLCLWQAGDNSRQWVTLDQIHARIGEWVDDYHRGFTHHGVGLDPELYLDTPPGIFGLIQIEEILGPCPSNGQTGRLAFTEHKSPVLDKPLEHVLDIRDGSFRAGDRLPYGRQDRRDIVARWFYRDDVSAPPQELDDLREALTPDQRTRFDKDRAHEPSLLLHVLFWPSPSGIVGTALLSGEGPGGHSRHTVALRPKGEAAMLLRAGPDADLLQARSAVIFGIGAIGSQLAHLLCSSGIGSMRLVDADVLWPANLIRHAAAASTPPSWPKTDAVMHSLQPFDWTDIETVDETVWAPSRLLELIDDVDLVVDATGDTAFAELLALISQTADRQFLTTALFRGGAVARVQRQAKPDDVPIAARSLRTGYPDIPPLDDADEYLPTLEVGCVAPINNAPPTAVGRAAALAAEVAIDALAARWNYPDEIIDVIRPTAPPFDRIGHVRRDDLPTVIQVTEEAQASMRTAAATAAPQETGGVLIGLDVDGLITIERAVVLAPGEPSTSRYQIPEGAVAAAVGAAQEHSPQLGYVGEFHNHPTDAGPSPTDRAMMRQLAHDRDTGTPVLIVVRPQTSGRPDLLDSYVATPGSLRSTVIESIGPLQLEEPG